MILLVCALREELRGYEAPADVTIQAIGVGPVESAIATVHALSRAAYSAVINVGIAGVFRNRGAVGDVFSVTSDALADLGLEGGGDFTLPGDAKLVERADADEMLVRRTSSCGLKRARGVTVNAVTTTDATATRLQSRYEADVETMEGFSVFRAALCARVPALGIRGISNVVGDRAQSAWDFRAGADAAIRGLEAILPALRAKE